MRISFGPFELDTARRVLLRGRAPVPLAPKPFGLLELLIERRPDAVDKAELLAMLWEGTFVSEGALTTIVNELRKALGESARKPCFVRTVHRYGYAFEGEAKVVEGDGPALRGTLIGRELRIRIPDGATLLGRSSKLAGGIPDLSVSRRHARIVATSEGVRIEDLGSRNGTFVNGEPADRRTELRDDDLVVVGSVSFRFKAQRVDSRVETRSLSSDSGADSQAASSPEKGESRRR